MKILDVKLKNKRKDKKYICFKIINYYDYVKSTQNYNVKLINNQISVPLSDNEENVKNLYKLSLRYFYWLLNDDKDINLKQNEEVKYNNWKRYIENYYLKFYHIGNDKLKDIAIQSFYTYKEAYEKI